MKFKILIFITLIIIVIIGYFAFVASKKSTKFQSPISQKSASPKKITNKLSTKTREYIDPAGFKFSYPENLNLQVIDKKDSDYYSSLQLKSPSLNGYITLEVKATKYNNIVEWTKNNKEIAGDAKDIKFGGLSAKEIKSDGKKLIVAVDLETLFTLTSTFSKEEQETWEDANNTIIATFAFVQPEVYTDGNEPESVGGDVVFEGEEVIE